MSLIKVEARTGPEVSLPVSKIGGNTRRRMTREDLLSLHETFCKRGRTLMEAKNADYAGSGGEQPFANFERTEALGVCRTEIGFLVRLTDKMSRLASILNSGEVAVKSESIEDTCIDVVNYIVLLVAYLEDKKSEQV